MLPEKKMAKKSMIVQNFMTVIFIDIDYLKVKKVYKNLYLGMKCPT